MIDFVPFIHRLNVVSEWTAAATMLLVGSDVFNHRYLVASTTIDLEEINTKVVLIGFGIAMVASRWGETLINFRKRYNETDHAQLLSCLEGREADRKAAQTALYAEQTARKNDLDRAREHYELMVRDYEERLANKHDQETYLKGLVEQGRVVESELRAANVTLTATVATQSEQIARLASLGAETTRKSVENTGAAIRESKSKDSRMQEPGVAVISAPSADRVDITVNQKEEK